MAWHQVARKLIEREETRFSNFSVGLSGQIEVVTQKEDIVITLQFSKVRIRA